MGQKPERLVLADEAQAYSYGYAFGASHEVVNKVILVGHRKAPG